MAKLKSAISGEYIIQIIETGQVLVYRIYDNVKESLREIAALKDFTIDPKWTTREIGRRIIKEFGEDDKVQIGEYFVERKDSGKIETYRHYANTKGALREIATQVGFEIDPKWNTQSAGSKLVNFLISKE